MADLTYLTQGLFTSFFPVTKAGEDAWRTIAETKGCEGGKILTIHLVAAIRQIRRAGLSITKTKRATADELDAIFNELEGLTS